jgi:hypothetical protein
MVFFFLSFLVGGSFPYSSHYGFGWGFGGFFLFNILSTKVTGCDAVMSAWAILCNHRIFADGGTVTPLGIATPQLYPHLAVTTVFSLYDYHATNPNAPPFSL